jgi:glycosyltransferase involved in cell wall biosynthesis
MVAYVARRLNEAAGSILMGREILHGLLASDSPVTVISNERCDVLREIDGRPLSTPQWFRAPGAAAFPRQLSRRYPKRLAAWAGGRWHDFIHRNRLQEITRGTVVVNGFGSNFVWDYLSPAPLRQAVLVVHDSPSRYALQDQSPLSWALEQMAPYSHYLFPSARVRDAWMQMDGLAERESCVIPNCCREDAVAAVTAKDRVQVRRKLGLPADRFLAVCVGTIHYRKGQDLLLELMPQLLTAVPNLHVVLVGDPHDIGGSEWGERVMQQIGTSQFHDRIECVGKRSDALEFIFAADALVLPSRSEVMPITILEAMALRTPVIASDVDGIPELIENGTSGLLFSQTNPAGLVNAFAALAADPEMRRAMAENASRRYWEKFSRQLLVSRVAQAINALVNGKSWCPAMPPPRIQADTTKGLLCVPS